MQFSYDPAYHCSCSLTLTSGLVVTLKSLSQRMTYAGLLEGVPSRTLNDGLIQDLLDQVSTDPSIGGGSPFLVPVQRRDYLREPGDMSSVSTLRQTKTEWLPMVTCIGYFESVSPARHPEMHSSGLAVIWLQDDYALPIPEHILATIRDLDWTSLAHDFEY